MNSIFANETLSLNEFLILETEKSTRRCFFC
jgi:hypothetical protein